MGNKTLLLLLLTPLLNCTCDGGSGLHQRRADIVVAPNPLVFDTVPRNTTASRALHIENPGDFRLEISSIAVEEGGSEGFAVVGETAFQIEPGEARDLEVTFTASTLATAEGSLLIRSNADQKAETRVTLQATRRTGPVLVVCVESIDIPLSFSCGSPSTIDFGRVRIDERREALVTLHSEGTDPVSVSSIALAGPPSFEIDAPAVPATIAVGESLQIPVRLIAAAAETFEGSIAIQSNDGVVPNAQVVLRGQGGETGLCIEPAFLDFGGVRAGTTKELPLKLSNCGSVPLDITAAELYLGNDVFAVVEPISSPITLPAQAGFNFEMKLRYAPTAEGRIDAGRLRITTGTGTALVQMTGDSNGCRIVVTPTSLAFNYDPTLGGEPKNILIENTGSQDCTVERVELVIGNAEGFTFAEGGPRGGGDGAGGGMGGGEPPPPGGGVLYWDVPKVLHPTELMTVGVAFWPFNITTSTVTGKIEIDVAERDDLYVVDLLGTVDFTSVCDLIVTPTALSYGVLNIGQSRVLGVSLRSAEGSFAPCKLDSIGLSEDAGGAYVLEETPPDVVFGESVIFIEFTPTSAGVHQGNLEIVTESDPPQTINVALAGGAGGTNICVEPRELPFGDRSTPGTLDFNISACGSVPITVSALDWTRPDPELSIFAAPALPFTLGIGETQVVTVQWDPADQVGDTGVLTVRSSDVLKPAIDVRATGGREIVPPEAGRYLYYWQILNGAQSDIMRQPLQGDLTSIPYWGDRGGQGCAGCHQLAPDGKYVAVTSFASTRGINVIDVEANAIATAPGSYVEALYMSWNPDVNTNPPYQYVYSQNGDLHVASLYTGYVGPVAGASDPNWSETMPSWGPNGQIVFVRFDGAGGIGFSGPSSLYLIDEAGGVATPLMGASSNNIANYYPRFSPNGDWIVFTVSESAQSTISALDAELRLVKADNSGQVSELPLANGGASSYPTWSVNGRFLSFSSNRAGGQGSWDIYIAPIDPTTGQEEAPTNVVEANTPSFEHSAQWSP